MKNKLVSLLLSAALLAPNYLPVAAAPETPQAVETAAQTVEAGYFGKQLGAASTSKVKLTEDARKIYDKLCQSVDELKTGKANIEITDLVNSERLTAYAEKQTDTGRQVFNDFSAAKDAFDLDHSEFWWFDSSKLALYLSKSGTNYKLWMGPRTSETYYIEDSKEDSKLNEEKIKTMDDNLNGDIKSIIDIVKVNISNPSYSEKDKAAQAIKTIHNEITKRISYRFETEVDRPEHLYIRTLYGLHTHKGVCEAYARSMQVIVNRAAKELNLKMEAVLVAGLQTSDGTKEQHMWNLVRIGDDEGWYGVDATWDDPVALDKEDKRIDDLKGEQPGQSGKERENYLLVGANTIGTNWKASGIVSSGNYEFTYPSLSVKAYAGQEVSAPESPLHVRVDSTGTVEGEEAGVFHVSYEVDGKEYGCSELLEKQGLYMLVKFHTISKDGTAYIQDQWYYLPAGLYGLGLYNEDSGLGNKYCYDDPDEVVMMIPTCTHIEIAVTNRPPAGMENGMTFATWAKTKYSGTNSNPALAYFTGIQSDIINETGRIANTVANYAALPYVKTQNPPQNLTQVAGSEYHLEVDYDDYLYHPKSSTDQGPIAKLNQISNKDFKITPPNEQDKERLDKISKEKVRIKCTVTKPDLNGNGVIKHIDLATKTNRDKLTWIDLEASGCTEESKWLPKVEGVYYVKNTDGFINWHYDSKNCPVHQGKGGCSVDDGCPITGYDFNFRASDQWIDDGASYQFSIEGVVGSRSYKPVGTALENQAAMNDKTEISNAAEVFVACPGECPACYRSQGIDWNLWGMPTLLENVSDFESSVFEMESVDGKTREYLDQLQEQMKVDDLNGRFTLVAEPINNKSQDFNKLTSELGKADQSENEIPLNEQTMSGSSVYEITFTRLCNMIALNPGQSLRMQFGFPDGTDGENYTFKAYHFTKCVEGSCTIKDPDHVHDGHIISIEEIPIAITPQGLVILCDSFSPFTIVGFDNKKLPDELKNQTDEKVMNESVIVNTDGNGKLLFQKNGDSAWKPATGADGMISMSEGETLTFAAEPNSDYQLDKFVFDNVIKEPDENGQFTISYEDVTGDESPNSMINASFIPKAIVKNDELNNIEVVPPATIKENSTLEIVNVGFAKEGSKGNEILTKELSDLGSKTVISDCADNTMYVSYKLDQPGKITAKFALDDNNYYEETADTTGNGIVYFRLDDEKAIGTLKEGKYTVTLKVEPKENEKVNAPTDASTTLELYKISQNNNGHGNANPADYFSTEIGEKPAALDSIGDIKQFVDWNENKEEGNEYHITWSAAWADINASITLKTIGFLKNEADANTKLNEILKKDCSNATGQVKDTNGAKYIVYATYDEDGQYEEPVTITFSTEQGFTYSEQVTVKDHGGIVYFALDNAEQNPESIGEGQYTVTFGNDKKKNALTLYRRTVINGDSIETEYDETNITGIPQDPHTSQDGYTCGWNVEGEDNPYGKTYTLYHNIDTKIGIGETGFEARADLAQKKINEILKKYGKGPVNDVVDNTVYAEYTLTGNGTIRAYFQNKQDGKIYAEPDFPMNSEDGAGGVVYFTLGQELGEGEYDIHFSIEPKPAHEYEDENDVLNATGSVHIYKTVVIDKDGNEIKSTLSGIKPDESSKPADPETTKNPETGEVFKEWKEEPSKDGHLITYTEIWGKESTDEPDLGLPDPTIPDEQHPGMTDKEEDPEEKPSETPTRPVTPTPSNPSTDQTEPDTQEPGDSDTDTDTPAEEPIVTETTTPAGSSQVETVYPEGKRVVETTQPDGTKSTIMQDTTGTVMDVVLPESFNTSKDSELDVPAVPAGTVVNVTLPDNWQSGTGEDGAENTGIIEIPVLNANPGFIVETEDGIIIPESFVDKDGSLLIPVHGNGKYVIIDNSKDFTDLPGYDKTSYPGAGVAYTSARGIINGHEDGRFDLDGKMTRGTIARILYNLVGNPSVAGLPIPAGVGQNWYTDAAAWAANQHLMAVGSNFRGDELLTREQLAMILYRYEGSPEVNSFDLTSYPDWQEISSPEMGKAVNWAVNNKIMGQGSPLNPQDSGTRGEIANMMYRYLTHQLG